MFELHDSSTIMAALSLEAVGLDLANLVTESLERAVAQKDVTA